MTEGAKKGDTVRVHYSGKLTDGTQFDSSQGRDPLEFVVGAGQMIPGFDAAVEGMVVGDKKTIHIPPAEAYGEWDEGNTFIFPKAQVPEDVTLEPGMQVPMQNEQGHQFLVTVAEIKDEEILMDANHMLAGKELIFDIEMVEITPEKGRIILP